jgi:hypothetical protein
MRSLAKPAVSVALAFIQRNGGRSDWVCLRPENQLHRDRSCQQEHRIAVDDIQRLGQRQLEAVTIGSSTYGLNKISCKTPFKAYRIRPASVRARGHGAGVSVFYFSETGRLLHDNGIAPWKRRDSGPVETTEGAGNRSWLNRGAFLAAAASAFQQSCPLQRSD